MDYNDDIVARLRLYAERQKQTRSTVLGLLLSDSADEIERLRRELGQVSDADSWVSKVDAALLDSLLNWCEFNAMDWHRALQRLVNDRARLQNALRLKQEELAACCIDRKEYKWDCFKEEADHNNNHFRTHHK